MKSFAALFLLAFSFLPATTRAQATLTIVGIVTEKGTGDPVSGAAVSVVGGKANEYVTDSEGKFSLTLTADVKPGATIRIRVVKDGYETWTNDIAASAGIPQPVSLKKLAKASPRKPEEKPEKPPENLPSTTIVQAPYGNLAERCEGLGTHILNFARERNRAQPDARSHRQGYLDWYTRNDGLFRSHFYDDAKALLRDLAAVNVRDLRLDELIARHEQYFTERNQRSPEAVFANAPMYHLSIEDIEEIGTGFRDLSIGIPQPVTAPRLSLQGQNLLAEINKLVAPYDRDMSNTVLSQTDGETEEMQLYSNFMDNYYDNAFVFRERALKKLGRATGDLPATITYQAEKMIDDMAGRPNPKRYLATRKSIQIICQELQDLIGQLRAIGE
jgi:hypothetical protein